MRFGLFFGSLLFGSFVFSQTLPEPTTAEGWIDRAMAAAQTGKRMETLSALDAALQLDPDNLRALNTLAWIQFGSRGYDDARITYEKILMIQPDSKEAHYGLAAIAAETVDMSRLEVRAKAAMSPTDPGPIKNIDLRIEFQDHYASAIQDGILHLERVLEKDPKFAPAIGYMSRLIRTRADFATDEEAFKRQIVEADKWAAKLPQQQPASASKQIQIEESVQRAKLIRSVPPLYPPLALQARIQGVVRFNVVIDAKGKVVNPTLVSGHPLLVPAAEETVQLREYEPTLLNGEPVEVVTTVTIEFTLN